MPKVKLKLAAVLHALLKMHEGNIKKEAFSSMLGDQYFDPQAYINAIKEHVPNIEEAVLIRKGVSNQEDLSNDERSIIHYVSTRDVDRDGDIMDPDGAILTEFRKAPVMLWGHNYSIPPVGSDKWIKSDGYGLKAKSVYATSAFAEELWTLRKEGHLKTSSVGFVPIEYTYKNGEGWDKLTKKLGAKWGEEPKYFEKVTGAIITKWLLLEHSDVSVPANINALTIAVSKGLAMSDDLKKEFGMDKEPKFFDGVKELDELLSALEESGMKVEEMVEAVTLISKSELTAQQVISNCEELAKQRKNKEPIKPKRCKEYIRLVPDVKLIESIEDKTKRMAAEAIATAKGQLL